MKLVLKVNYKYKLFMIGNLYNLFVVYFFLKKDLFVGEIYYICGFYLDNEFYY